MIKKYLAIAVLISACLTVAAEPLENCTLKRKTPLMKLEEFHRRDGLPNIFHKISTQRLIRIAYLGGSITAASEGWRDLTFSWFRLHYPQTAFYQINSAMGGTGSAMTFNFLGNELGLYDCMGPGTGIIEVTIDGKTQEIKRFDQFCTYWRSNAVFLDSLTQAVHHVEITVSGKEFDKKPVMKPACKALLRRALHV